MEEESSMSPEYFRLICIEISKFWTPDGDRIELLIEDLLILEVFCKCLETWRLYSIAEEENEESMERLRSLITSLKVIWPEDLTLVSLLHERVIWPEEMRGPINVRIQDDFDSVMSGLKAKILQTKPLVEAWCRNSIHSSLMVHCESSPDFHQEFIFYFLKVIRMKLPDLLRHRLRILHTAGPLNKLLKARIFFLEGKLIKVLDSMYKEEGFQFLEFIGGFAYGVACLTCLYWARKKDFEFWNIVPTKKKKFWNIVLFDMLHKFIPYAFHITQLYVGILKSNDDLQLVSDSFLLEEVVEGFVDFFFEHLAIVLKDDFLFLRDRLLFLFTFLIGPPNENAEGDLIRSQINAILHEDVYLLMSFDEMKKDFSGEKALLSGFMTRIDIANAKIRGSSESWITFEYDYIVSVHRELSSIEKFVRWGVREQIQLYKMELRFLRVFLQWLATWDDADEQIKVKLRSMVTSFRGIWGEKEAEGLLVHRLHAIRKGSSRGWRPLVFELQAKIQQSKLETEAWCVSLLNSSFQFKTSTSYKILKFLGSIHDNLNDLVSYKASKIIPFKKQIEALEGMLIFLRNFFKLAMNCGELEMLVQAFANDAAWLSILYWENAKSAEETNSILVHMSQKIKPATPDVAGLYFGALTTIYVQQSHSLMFGQTAFRFVHFFLEDLAAHLKDVDFQILQDNIVFLLTFLKDPLSQNAEEPICSRIDLLFWEGLYSLIPFDDIEGGFSKKKVLLSEFMMKIEAINADIRCIYGKFPHSSLYNFPKVVSPQFLDFLLQNLRNLRDRMNSDRKYAPFAKYKIIKIEEELASLCPFFIHIFNLQSELNELWLEVVNVLHLTEHVVMSSISSWFVYDYPFWYHMTYLSNVLDEIKVVKAKLEMVKLDNIINNAKCLPSSVGFISELAEQGRPSEINETVVGFEDEEEKIIGMLISGSESLDIVSIVGMGGLGKTTLARKAFRSPIVKRHFDVFGFCSVSHDHDTRRLLLEILRDVKGVDHKRRDMTNDDLAHQLWQCLSGQKYLIVLDDIWKVSAWNELKSSFPNHKNGSRVMFTTRSREVADECKINCSPHQLRLLNDDESWKLLQAKVFRNDISPPYLREIGKQIAKNCKGLALAVVVIGGLLARTEESLSRWSEVAERIVYYLSKEGCMDILDLSYKHLPENLKPCLIYLGAFPENSLISVKHVILLWISEGFIQESKTKNLEDVAREYFHELVARSFIITSARSSSGGIKAFHVHDLIRELCQMKCRDGNFFHLKHESASSSSSEPSVNNHYRVSTQKESDVTNVAGSSLSDARTIHIFCGGGPGKVPLRKSRLVQVLDLGIFNWDVLNDINQLTSLIHLRYINAILVNLKNTNSIPSSISNLWNIISIDLTVITGNDDIQFPETFWRMKHLRYVNVHRCILKFPDEADLSDDQIMDKVVSFSKPIISTGKDVKRLLQRLPVVRKLGCTLKNSPEYKEESIETLDFYVELESLTLTQAYYKFEYIINFPSTLKKLTLDWFILPWTTLSSIAELPCLQVLKLRYGSFVESSIETEDLVFRNLKFFELIDYCLEEWNASVETFPCLEQLVIECERLKELPPCFGELPTLKRIGLNRCSPENESSVLRIQEELTELGIKLEVSILNTYYHHDSE